MYIGVIVNGIFYILLLILLFLYGYTVIAKIH